MKKVFNVKEMFKKLNKKNDNGFSLLELVVSIGILLVLTVGGLIGYSAISDNAKQAAVERAASDVVKAIAIKESSSSFTASNISFQTVSSNKVYSEPQDAADEWMETAGDKNKIIVTASENSDLITVKAVYEDDTSISAVKTVTMSSIRDGNSGSNNEEENTPESNLIQLEQGTCHYLIFAYWKADYNYTKDRSTPNVQKIVSLKNKGDLTDEELKEFNDANSNTQKNEQKKTEAGNNLINNNDAYDEFVIRSERKENSEGKKLADNVEKTASDYVSETEKINLERDFENPDKVNEMYIESLNANANFINFICK